MAITLDVFKAQVDALITADDTEFPDLARYRQIKAALERYSIDRPDNYTEDEAGDAGRYYILEGTGAVLANWSAGFSRIISIEYPAATVASDETPVYLERADWRDDYWVGALRYLYLPSHAPAATETMRIKFTVPYGWSESTTTTGNVTQTTHGFSVGDYIYKDGATWFKATDQRIATHIIKTAADVNTFTAALLQADPPATDFFAVCNLAAAFCCQAIAAKYSRTSDSTINADSVGHTSRAGEFARRAKEFETLYRTHIGLGTEAETKAAGAFADLNTKPGWPTGRRYLFHRGR